MNCLPVFAGEKRLLLSARLGNTKLEQLLGSESCFGYGCVILDEAIIETIAVAYGNDVTALIEIIIGIDTVRSTRLLDIFELAVATRKNESLFGVGEMSFSYQIERLVINEHTHLYVGFK